MENFLIVMRFVEFTSSMVLFGSLAFPLYAVVSNETRRACGASVSAFLCKLTPVLSWLALGAALGWLAAESTLMSGMPDGYRRASILVTVLTQTQFGRIWFLRVIALLAFIIYCRSKRASLRSATNTPAILMSLFLVITLAGVGHGAMGTGNQVYLHLLNQALHLLFSALWIGGLVALFWICRGVGKTPVDLNVVHHVLQRFSGVALIAVLAIVATGSFNSWFLVGSKDALLHSSYGHLLLIKISLVSLMVLAALFNRLALLPRLLTGVNVRTTLKALLLSVAVEQILALMVLGCVSVLGTLPPGFAMQDMAM